MKNLKKQLKINIFYYISKRNHHLKFQAFFLSIYYSKKNKKYFNNKSHYILSNNFKNEKIPHNSNKQQLDIIEYMNN